MTSQYVYNEESGTSYPCDYAHPTPACFTPFFDAHRFDTRDLYEPEPYNPLYAAPLRNLSSQTQNNLTRLKQKLVKIDPCYEYGAEHWHRDQKNKKDGGPYVYPEHACPEWENHETLFTSGKEMSRVSWKNAASEDKNTKNNDSGVVPICYLCSTLDEHKQHLAKRGPQLKAKHKPRQRVHFVAPRPIVAAKVPETEERCEALYKIIVRTGSKPDAGTSANVTIRLSGRRGKMKKRKLQKKLAANFSFGRCTEESFFIKGPDVGEPRYLTVEHDGLEKKHSWFLDEIEVIVMATGQSYVFVCKQWLSLYLADLAIKRDLKAELRDLPPDVDYEVTVITANKMFSGTDANVFITVYGKKGSTSKIQLRNKSKNNFEKGQKDKFHLTTKELGPVTSIKIEHDNSGSGPGWLLEQVLLQDENDARRCYTFPCGQWLAEDEGDGKTSRMLYPLKQGVRRHTATGLTSSKDGTARDSLDYEVVIVTGTCSYAGTDANIYIQMIGKLGKSNEIPFLDTDGKKFEKGARDIFNIRSDDVGDLKSIAVRHDNKGLAAGWFLDQIVIRRHFSKYEVRERLSALQSDIDKSVARRTEELTGSQVDVQPRTGSMKHRGSVTWEQKEIDRDEEKEKQRRQEKEQEKQRREKQDLTKELRGKLGSGRRSKQSRRDDSEETDSQDEEDDHGRNNRQKRRQKKIVYNGIVEYVTDSDSERESKSDRRRERRDGSRRRDKRRGRYSESETESSGDERRGRGIRGRGRSSKERRYDTDSDREVDRNGRRKSKSRDRGKKRDSDSEDGVAEDGYRKVRARKAREDKRAGRGSERRQNNRHGSDSDAESDDESRGRRRGQRRSAERKRGRRPRHSDDDDDSSDDGEKYTIWKKDRIPCYDEYLFPCSRWLADNEDDGLIARTLKAKSVTTFYKMA